MYWRTEAPTRRPVGFEYFRNSTLEFEAFKNDQVDWRTEISAKNWATAYDFPAVRDHRVVRELFPIHNPGLRMQAFAFNTRRDKFKDARVRQACDFAFDFEEMNKQLLYGQYRRIVSYFDGTEFASSGSSQTNHCRPVSAKCRPRCSCGQTR